MSLYDDISLEKVVRDREFYKSPESYFFERKREIAEIRRIGYGIYLMRAEMFRLRAKLAGLPESMVEDNAPEFVEGSISIYHWPLQQAEYLRADLIILAANVKRLVQ